MKPLQGGPVRIKYVECFGQTIYAEKLGTLIRAG